MRNFLRLNRLLGGYVHRFENLTTLLIVLLLTGCQSSAMQVSSAKPVLHDEVFADFEAYPLESKQQIFELNDDAKTFVAQSLKGVFNPIDQIEMLVRSVFSRSEFNLLYRADANTTATQTFENRAANCLSMSIMTYSLAKEAGFGVRFQDISVPEYWTRREGHSLLNRHINLQVLPKPDRNSMRFLTMGFEVDFDAQATRKHFPKSFLTLNQVHAMFYNNKGADALMQGHYEKAYAYFRGAITLEPESAATLANLGFLYRLSGHFQFAEESYLQAIRIDQDNLTAWKNLAFLYEHTQRFDKATEISNRVEAKRAKNPFYHVNLGDMEYENKNWQLALDHYRAALKIDKSYHEVFFGLGKTYFELGDLARSQHYLKLAKKKSRTEQEEEIYQGKLALLSRLRKS
jgi:tetratricopeptide (TPR) repeat protein